MLSKTIIDKQVNKVASEYFKDLYNNNVEDKKRALSRSYTLLTMKYMLDIDEDVASDCIVDGNNDFAIDGIYFTEPQNEYFDIYIYQIKYSSKLDKDYGIKEIDIIKMIESIKKFFSIVEYDTNNKLHQKLIDINNLLEEFNIPNFHIYFCNNGQGWSNNSQKLIDDFLDSSIENRKRFTFNYVNHNDVFKLFEKNKPVDCFLNFSGRVIDEAINFKRAFVGKVSVSNIHSLMKEHGNRLLKQNVRDFLGFSKVVNKAIKQTLVDDSKKNDFYFLNNGITFVCEKIDYATGSDSVRAKLSNAQIINGDQTSKTIEKVVEENPNENFNDTYVLVRVYQIDMDSENEFVNAITTATNSQNAIFAKDLKANDVIQQKITLGLKKYGINYLRRRNDRRAKKDDIRMEMVAEVLLSCLLKKPQDAKYRKSLHFTEEYYTDIFNESRINIEMIYFTVFMFKKIESIRKQQKRYKYPFVPFASHYILMIMYSNYEKKYGKPTHVNFFESKNWLTSEEFNIYYNEALEIIKNTIKAIDKNPNDALDIVNSLKNKDFNNNLIKAIEK